MFDTKTTTHYLFIFGLIIVASYFGNSFKQAFAPKNDEYEMIRKYLLNDSPLYGFNKPKLWIHSKYEINSRKWKSFQSRSSNDLNQPYLHLTIKTIINHCGEDFNVCLIDDESFSNLIPSWDIKVNLVAEPMKSHYRELGMANLLYLYGGLVVPNSFICMKNLKEMYSHCIQSNQPFVCENVNHAVNLAKQTKKMLFTPNSFFMGAPKNNETIRAYIEYLKIRNQNPHFNSEVEFLGQTQQWFIEAIQKQQLTLVGGEMIGVKTIKRKAILLDDLMSDNYLDLDPNTFGLYIPADELLIRTKYQWYAVLSADAVLQASPIISKYIMASIVDTSNEYHNQTKGEIRSVIAI
jgi:hypothetical protein